MTDDRATASLLRHFGYWMLPCIVTLVFIGCYFSGIDALRELAAPRANREFGIIENFQLVVLAIAVVASVRGFLAAATLLDRFAFAVLALGCLFLALEEIDYGLHFYEYFHGESGLEVRNLHNQPGRLALFKNLSEAVTIGFFVVLPLVSPYLKSPLVRRFAPDRLIVVTVLCGLALGLFAHQLNKAGLYADGPLRRNMSEFRETFTHYAFMLYCLELAARLGRSGAAKGA